jgi:hypothetical protein
MGDVAHWIGAHLLRRRDAERRDPVPERDPDDRVERRAPDLRLLGVGPPGSDEARVQLAMALARPEVAELTYVVDAEREEVRLRFAAGDFVIGAERLSMEWEAKR